MRQKKLLLMVGILCVGLMVAVLPFRKACAGEAGVYKWKLADPAPAQFKLALDTDAFIKGVYERSGGKIQILHYPGGQLGSQSATFSMVREGGLEMAIGSGEPGHDPRLNIAYMPYLIYDWDQAEKFTTRGGVLWNIMSSIYDDLNIKLLSIVSTGFVEVCNTRRPVHTVADMKGLKLRTLPYKTMTLAYEALGASPVFMDFGEMFPALQTGVIDGEAANSCELHYLLFKKLIKYVSQIRAFYGAPVLIMNANLFKSMPAEYRRILVEECDKFTAQRLDFGRTSEEDYLKKLEEAGVQVDRLTDAEMQKFFEVGRSTWPQIEPLVGKDLMDKIKEAIKQ